MNANAEFDEQKAAPSVVVTILNDIWHEKGLTLDHSSGFSSMASVGLGTLLILEKPHVKRHRIASYIRNLVFVQMINNSRPSKHFLRRRNGKVSRYLCYPAGLIRMSFRRNQSPKNMIRKNTILSLLQILEISVRI